MLKGRPRLQKDKDSRVTAFSMSDWEMQLWDKYCEQYGVSRSELFRFMFQTWRDQLSKYAPKPK